jgi:hypothetical protein
MANAEAEWRAFRRYEYKDIEISEAPGRIRFTQMNMNSYNKTGSRIISVICAIGVFGPAFVIGSQGGEAVLGAFIWFLLSGLVAGLVIFVSSFALRVPVVLEITPDQITLTRGEGTQNITQIRSLEVRREAQWANIYIWDGPAPVYLFSFASDQIATAVHQGILAAIKYLNNVEDEEPLMTADTVAPASRAPTPAKPAPPSRRFPE